MMQLIVCRAIQGLGAGALMTVSFAIMADLYPPRERGRLFGVFGSVFGIATVIGPFIGGFLTDHGTFTLLGHEVAGWRWVFYVNLPLGLLALFMIMYRMPVLRHGAGGRIDYLGAVLVVLTAATLLLGLTLGGTTLSVGLAAHPRAVRGRRRFARDFPVDRDARRASDPAAASVPHPFVSHRCARVVRHEHGVPRRRDVHAAVHAGRAGHQRDAERLRAAAADGRTDRQQHHLRPARDAHRSLQALHDRRRRRADRRRDRADRHRAGHDQRAISRGGSRSPASASGRRRRCSAW